MNFPAQLDIMTTGRNGQQDAMQAAKQPYLSVDLVVLLASLIGLRSLLRAFLSTLLRDLHVHQQRVTLLNAPVQATADIDENLSPRYDLTNTGLGPV